MLKDRAGLIARDIARLAKPSLLRSWLQSNDGISAVEFALIMPVLMLMLGGALEISGVITAGNRATYVAETIGQVVSQSRSVISVSDMQGFIESAALVDPDIVRYANATGKALDQAVNIAVSSVVFKPTVASCSANCTYEANVVFSEALSGGKRSCGTLSAGATDLSSLPSAAFSPSSLVVVDVEVFYKPVMTLLLGSTVSFKRSTYFVPRHIDHVNYVNNCPGYPSN